MSQKDVGSMSRKVKPKVEIHLGDSKTPPLFKQIAEQVRQLIATERLRPGERMPTVSQMSNSLGISISPALKACRELQQNGPILSRGGGGTWVAAGASDPRLLTIRQTRLSNRMSNSIRESLSQGYSLDEVEATFSVHLDRWWEELTDSAQAAKGRSNQNPAHLCRQPGVRCEN